MMSRNISNLLSLTHHVIFVGSKAGYKHSCIPKNFPPVYLLFGIAALLRGTVPQSQPLEASYAPV